MSMTWNDVYTIFGTYAMTKMYLCVAYILTKKFKSDTSKLVKYSENLIRKGNVLPTIVHSL